MGSWKEKDKGRCEGRTKGWEGRERRRGRGRGTAEKETGGLGVGDREGARQTDGKDRSGHGWKAMGRQTVRQEWGGRAEGLTRREGDGWEPEGGETRLGT